MMNNGYDPDRALLLQRLLAAQQAQRGLEIAHSHRSGANPLLGQFLGVNVLDRFPLSRPSDLRFNPAPDYGMLQSMIRMNNERANADRERHLQLERANQELAARLMADGVTQQGRIMQINTKGPKRSDHSNSNTRLHLDAAAVREREYAEIEIMVQSQREMVHVEHQKDTDTSKDKIKAPKEKAPKEKPSKPKRDTKWLASYQEILQYKDDYGDCIVPRGFPLNPQLASWVAEQRKQYKLLQDGKNSSITPRRIELLNKIGFAWNAQEAAWEKHITDLKAFKEEYGDCLVPLNHPKYPKLGLWVKEQRRHYTLMKQEKPSHMTEERARALDAVGFCWDTHEAVWGERLRELCEYKAQFGDCIVPTNFPANPKLGTWVHHQRRQYKKHKEGKSCHITDERVRALDNIGFVWYPRERTRRLSEATSSDQDSDTESESDDGEEEVAVRPKKRRRSHGM
ncbi:hypothetical protein MHU86_2102 [Fragilaria crotonensis]|nr:hypothetical protein MHU86_2102 [Fragilaria crotonensis]